MTSFGRHKIRSRRIIGILRKQIAISCTSIFADIAVLCTGLRNVVMVDYAWDASGLQNQLLILLNLLAQVKTRKICSAEKFLFSSSTITYLVECPIIFKQK